MPTGPQRKPPPRPGSSRNAIGTGRTPPPRPTRGRAKPPPSLAAEYAPKNNIYGTVSQRLAPPASAARVEQSREVNARISSARNRQIGKDPQDRSLSSWRSDDKGYRKP